MACVKSAITLTRGISDANLVMLLVAKKTFLIEPVEKIK
jgi:hypothetical protein